MVSVIIPIYNTGKYLYPCLESVCKQTYEDLQILMIDDGSNAETAKICDEISLKDSRIEVIHKHNEGVSIARNIGLSVAKGDIVCFVDSDDTIEPNMIGQLVYTLNQSGSDIAICDAITLFPDSSTEPDTIAVLEESCVLKKSEISPAMLTQLAGSAWRCAYRRTDMFSGLAKFPVGIKFSEDRIFNIIAMGLADRIAYIKEPFYNRLIRKGSACFRYYPDMTEQIVKLRRVLLDSIKQYWGTEYSAVYESQIAGQIRYAITNYTAPYSQLSLSRKIEQIKMLCSNHDIRECVGNSGASDIRSRLILSRRYILLTLLGFLTNKYHQLCKIGQYRQ